MEIKIPQYIYKFRAFDENWKKLLIDNEIYFPSPTELNDPFDSQIPIHYFSGTEYQIRKYFSQVYDSEQSCESFVDSLVDIKARVSKDELEDSEREFTKQYNQELGIFSCSVDSKNRLVVDNLLQWAHYANGSRGFCVKYDTEKLLNSVLNWCESSGKKIEFVRVDKVLYQDEFPFISPYDSDDSVREISDDERASLKFIKSSHWHNENEYRLVLKFGRDVQRNIRIAEDAIDSIYLGLQIGPKDEDSIIDVIKERNSKIKIFKSKFKSNHFGLKFVEELLTK